jgi:hypothetical protein
LDTKAAPQIEKKNMRPAKEPPGKAKSENKDKPKTPVRMPQRSEAVSGNEKEGVKPIAAAQKKPAKH